MQRRSNRHLWAFRRRVVLAIAGLPLLGDAIGKRVAAQGRASHLPGPLRPGTWPFPNEALSGFQCLSSSINSIWGRQRSSAPAGEVPSDWVPALAAFARPWHQFGSLAVSTDVVHGRIARLPKPPDLTYLCTSGWEEASLHLMYEISGLMCLNRLSRLT